MSAQWKKCPNGHYYQGSSCPYCSDYRNGDSNRTEIFIKETETNGNIDSSFTGETSKTSIEEEPTMVDSPFVGGKSKFNPSRTVFGDENDVASSGSKVNHDKPSCRVERKLVGWLVSYTWDCCGLDYRLYEGRNIIGRDGSCQISIGDGKISAVHAVLLFRSGKFSITDQQSSHGTFINGEDIELEPRYLKDGDVITIGNTELKFRSAL